MLSNDTEAPDFQLASNQDKFISLSDLLGKKVILVFYPADWSPVCGDELSIFNTSLKLFEKYNAEVLGISVDGKWSHTAFSQNRGIKFPLLSDFEPKGEVSRLYDVYNNAKGVSQRGIYLIDESGMIRWSHLSLDGVNLGVDGVLDALDEFAKGE